MATQFLTDSILSVQSPLGMEVLQSTWCLNDFPSTNFKYSPIRCSRCLTKNWCSKECPFKDWQKRHEEFCQKDSDARKIKGGAEVRKDVGSEELEKCFDKLLKHATSFGPEAEQNFEKVKKLYKSEEKSKVVKKSKSQKTRVKE